MNSTTTANTTDTARLRHKLETGEHPLPGFSDHVLEKFLAARKQNIDRAEKLVRGHCAWKKEKFGMGHLDMPTAEAVLPVARLGVFQLPGVRDVDGSLVVFVRPARIDLDAFTPLDLVRCLWYMLDKACDDKSTRTNGFTVVEDLTGVDAAFLSSAIPSVPKEVVAGIIGAIPARLREVYICNQTWWVKTAICAARSTFIPEKIGSKVHICGDDYTKVHQRVLKEHLPTELGGLRDAHKDEVAFLGNPQWFPVPALA